MYSTGLPLVQGGLPLLSQCNHRRKNILKFSNGKQRLPFVYSKTGIKLNSEFLRSYFCLRPNTLDEKHKKLLPAIQAQYTSGSSIKRNGLSEEESLDIFLEEQPGNLDFTAEVLKSTPSQVEAKYLVDGKLITLREKESQKVPLIKRLKGGLRFQSPTKVGKEIRTAEGQTTDQEPTGKKSVYLSDLLREYKGELYVPEEAFKNPTPDLDSFQKNINTLPVMTFAEFLTAAKAGQVTLLTSRGMLGSRKYIYHDFIIDLKNIPGEEPLHRRKWAMHLTDDEAQIALREYRGPQVEVETQYTPYISPPPSLPNPVASSISGKVVLELAVASGLIATMAYTIGGFLSAVVFMGISVVTITMAYVVVPILIPLLWPIQALTLKLIQGLGIILFGGFTNRRGIPGVISKLYGFFTSGTLYTNARLLGVMVLVGGSMALIAKFTLTRRPKDFTKWDLWQAIEFGQSKPQARVEGTTGVQFADIAGIDDVVEELQELVTYLKNPERFNQMGTKPPHGVLLEGPPGCGKTLLAKAIAGEAGVPFYQMAGSEFVEVLVGVGAARVRDLFKRAKVNRPSVVFIDEIDALGAMRHGGEGDELEDYNAGSQERETTLNQLLIELDGFDTGKGVIFLGATNRMDMLDPALLRPGRFDRKITVKPPRAKGRLEILKVHARNVNLAPEVDLWTVAKNLPGWSGAELAQLLQEGAMMAVRNGHDQVKQRDLDQAVDRITIGPQRMGVGRGLAVHRRMATLEVGLAMTTHLLRRLEGAKLEFCERISIIPRGETLSRTIFERLDDEAYFFERRSQLLQRMQVFLGGRAAEEIIYGRDTSSWTIASLRDASWMARKLVTIWNLEGPMTVRGERPPWKHHPHFSGPPLDFEGWLYNDYRFTEHTLNYKMDFDVAKFSEDLVKKMYDKTLTMLQRHQAALMKAIYVLLEKDEIYGDELDLILDNYPEGTPVQLVENEMDPAALPTNTGKTFSQEISSPLVGVHLNSKNES